MSGVECTLSRIFERVFIDFALRRGGAWFESDKNDLDLGLLPAGLVTIVELLDVVAADGVSRRVRG